jgi:hypothetical protein
METSIENRSAANTANAASEEVQTLADKAHNSQTASEYAFNPLNQDFAHASSI